MSFEWYTPSEDPGNSDHEIVARVSVYKSQSSVEPTRAYMFQDPVANIAWRCWRKSRCLNSAVRVEHSARLRAHPESRERSATKAATPSLELLSTLPIVLQMSRHPAGLSLTIKPSFALQQAPRAEPGHSRCAHAHSRLCLFAVHAAGRPSEPGVKVKDARDLLPGRPRTLSQGTRRDRRAR